MNLIKQLGSYEKARDWIRSNADDVKHGYLEDYERELLEYRRRHGIFEEGDYIIYDGEFMVFAMWSEIKGDYAYIGYADDDDGLMVSKDDFKHATDSEIAKGKRDEN
jgi:hypothetical protein